MDRRQFHTRSLALLGAAAALPRAARAQARPVGPGGYPNRPIKLIVPYPAGGVVDVVTRALTDPLSAELPQRIEKLEADIHSLTAEMASPVFYQQDSAEITRVVERLKSMQDELAQAYHRWEELEKLHN